MTACTHRLDDTGLACTRDEHSDRGHVYVGSSDDLGKHGKHSDETRES